MAVRPDPDRANAAIALVLRPPQGCVAPVAADCSVLLIRRAESERDPWSGQMAFPGGRMDPVDSGLSDAAMRETREETGVELGHPLGCLEPLRPYTARIPAIAIRPFVFRVAPSTRATVNSDEVASVHWFPLSDLRSPSHRGSYLWDYGGVRSRFPCIRLHGQVIWGLTYRALTQLLRVVDAGYQSL